MHAPHRHRRPSSRSLAGFLVLLLAAACGAPEAPPAAPATVRFGFIQALDQVPLPVMQQERLAERHGLRLEEQPFAGGKTAIEAIEAGTLDVAYAGSLPVLAAARRGAFPDKVLVVGASSYADAGHPGMTVLAAPSVRTWADLDGRDIGVNQIGSIGEVAMRIRLQQEGVQARFVEIPFPNQGLAVAGGNVAAAVMTEPFTTQSLLRGDGRILDQVIGGGAPFPEFTMSFIVVRAALVREQPDAVRALLRAHLEAVEWISGHEGEARTLMARKLGLDDRVAAGMKMSGLVAGARVDAAVLAAMQATLAAADPALAPIPADRLSDETLLRAVVEKRR